MVMATQAACPGCLRNGVVTLPGYCAYSETEGCDISAHYYQYPYALCDKVLNWLGWAKAGEVTPDDEISMNQINLIWQRGTQ